MEKRYTNPNTLQEVKDVYYASLHDLKNYDGQFGPTNDERAATAKFIDEARKRAKDQEDHWIYTTSYGLGPEGTPATSDATDPRRHRRGAKNATLPKKSEPPPLPEWYGKK